MIFLDANAFYWYLGREKLFIQVSEGIFVAKSSKKAWSYPGRIPTISMNCLII